jgi:hypothetical protein
VFKKYVDLREKLSSNRPGKGLRDGLMGGFRDVLSFDKLDIEVKMTIKGNFREDALVGKMVIDEPGVMNRTAEMGPGGELMYIYEDASVLEEKFDDEIADFDLFK